MSVLNNLAQFVGKNFPALRRKATRFVINKFGYAARIRPRPFTMASPFTTWRSLTDRKYSGRHLPPAHAYTKSLPPVEEVLTLFKRQKEIKATDTSLLFPFFAQWFTDSFLRTKWTPEADRHFRENESNHEIDLCQIYGMTEAQTSMLREHAGGRLKTDETKQYPARLMEKVDGAYVLRKEYLGPFEGVQIPQGVELSRELEGLYSKDNFNRVFYPDPPKKMSELQKENALAVGLEHGNSTLGNAAMNILFLREHNRVADIIAMGHPDWSDEQVFQTARNVCITILLKIVIKDYIVHIAPIEFPLDIEIGFAEKESWYRTNWIPIEFALLYRWHGLIPDHVTFGGQELPSTSLLNNNQMIFDLGLDQILLDAATQKASKIGIGNTPDFLMKVKKLSLEMARSCELASFNEYRQHFGLKPLKSFDEVTKDTSVNQRLKELYGDIDKLEWIVGIFAENYEKDDLMGDLMMTMVANDAFTQALTNPLLAKDVYNEKTFSPEGFKIVEETNTLAQVISRNTSLHEDQVSFKI
jgi:prostaglandin-endoperoxide synthase 2